MTKNYDHLFSSSPVVSSLSPSVVYVQVFGMAWSPDGKLLATVCKDGKVRIYDPRKSAAPVQVRKITLIK